MVTPAIWRHVATFAVKTVKLEIGNDVLFKSSGTISLQTWASLLSCFMVTAIVLIPASVACRATLMLPSVLPVADIKQYVLSSWNLEFNRSDGL
jgi:hypothetical protein